MWRILNFFCDTLPLTVEYIGEGTSGEGHIEYVTPGLYAPNDEVLVRAVSDAPNVKLCHSKIASSTIPASRR